MLFRSIVGLKHQAFVREIGEFEKNPFGLASGVRKTIECYFFSACGQPHAKIILNQLEVPVVVTEEGGSISAFS